MAIPKFSSNVVFIQQLFTLLSIFGKDKNQLAPSIYKILVNKFQTTINEVHSRIFIQNFKDSIEEFPTIPFQPVIDAISTRIEENTFHLTETEIELFFILIRNESLDPKGGLIIYNLVSKLLIE